jgi:crotonobetainyl-CoA:carnitine CoA-transferase CaiB-like acyl-CoA transferase
MSDESTSPVPLPHPAGPLAGYRVLDLADEKGQLCARMLAELGADVIKVERPREGDPTRANGPFFRDEQGAERSLYWWAMNAGKRSITLQLQLEAGRDLFRRLVEHADIVIETFTPGVTKDLGIDYRSLERINPGVILVSITPWGQTGPYRHWPSSDIVGSAMGGHMYLNGDDERGPVRTTAPQAYTQANVQGAVGAVTALYARGVNDGMGQHVDVSMQEAMANAMDHAQTTWDISGLNVRGPGLRRTAGATPERPVGARYLFEASDGWVVGLSAGEVLVPPRANIAIDWMAEHGAAGDLDTARWRQLLTSMEPKSDEEIAHVEEVVAGFCRQHPREWLVGEAQARGLGWAPVYSPGDIVHSKQLEARDYWVRVRHDDLGETFVYPGAPYRLGETPWMQRGRAPHVGEHNEQVYGELLGLEAADLRRLRARMVI